VNGSVAVADLRRVLETAVSSPASLREQVAAFLRAVNDAEVIVGTPAHVAVVRDLAYDLAFFVPNRKHRAEDPVYFGPSRALDEIRSALVALNRGEA
jgi:hypothetical protein